MKVLILGGGGYIGRHIVDDLKAHGHAPIIASRHANARGDTPALKVDSLDAASLTRALADVDAVVNCVAGDRRSIAEGAAKLVEAASAAGLSRLVHLSTMSVYGAAEGVVREDAPLRDDIGWYGTAKCEAERIVRAHFGRPGEARAVILRPGCVYGAGSELWVGRIARCLEAGRLGDLGVAGDGWSNLVDVRDVARAVRAALLLPVGEGQIPTYNLSAPDSPRWNEYFVALALGIGATPVRRISALQIKLDARLAGPPLKIAEKLLTKFGPRPPWLPEVIPPSITRLFAQQIRLDSAAATRDLQLQWTSYSRALAACTAWWRSRPRQR